WFTQVPLGGNGKSTPVGVETGDGADTIEFTTAIQRYFGQGSQFGFIHLAAGDDVGHTGNSVRAVNGGTAVQNQFKTVHGDFRNVAQVHRVDFATGTRTTRTTSVQQHQR